MDARRGGNATLGRWALRLAYGDCCWGLVLLHTAAHEQLRARTSTRKKLNSHTKHLNIYTHQKHQVQEGAEGAVQGVRGVA